jgi:aspartokinase/homoserine dehydrogenase 1
MSSTNTALRQPRLAPPAALALAVRRAAVLASNTEHRAPARGLALAPWRVLKYGGTSVATAERIARVIARVDECRATARVLVVVSALVGVTDYIESLIARAVQGDAGLANAMHALRLRHLDLLDAVAGTAADSARAAIDAQIDTLRTQLNTARGARAIAAPERAAALAGGERLSAAIVSAALAAHGTPVLQLDSTALLSARGYALDADLDSLASAARAGALLDGEPRVVVCTGFFAGDHAGRALLLGRGGSDTVATALGAALAAEAVEIWTDVDGIADADPRLIAHARVLKELSYHEAALLARHGARVLHAKSIEPAARAAVPVLVRNTLDPSAPGTRIAADARPASVPLFAAPAAADGIATVAVLATGAATALAARAQDALAHAAIEPLALEPGFDADALLVRVPAPQREATLRTLHRSLGRNPHAVDVVLIGARGQVGSALRAQWARERVELAARTGVQLELIAAFDRRGLARADSGLDPLALEPQLRPRAAGDWEALRARLGSSGRRVVVVDCTASDQVADQYRMLLAAGIAVVTPNKRASSRDYAQWRELGTLARRHAAPWRYETTVGAALPVIGTLRDLRLRGERVTRIEGVLSGSLSYVLGRLQAGTAFSAAVAEARELGYTEPDPRDDLEARDLARKALILAREAGFALEPEQVAVTPLIDPDWSPDVADAAADARWRERVHAAAQQGRRLVALVAIEADRASVAVRELPLEAALARLAPGENLVRIHTEYHADVPIAVAGPGAGAAVTAAGVFSDLIAAARELSLHAAAIS